MKKWKSAKNGPSDELFAIRIYHPTYFFTPDPMVITVFCQTPVFAKKKGSENFKNTCKKSSKKWKSMDEQGWVQRKHCSGKLTANLGAGGLQAASLKAGVYRLGVYCLDLKKGKGLKNRALKKTKNIYVFLHFFWPFFLSKFMGLAKKRYHHWIGRKKLCGNPLSDPEKLNGRSQNDHFSCFWFFFDRARGRA